MPFHFSVLPFFLLRSMHLLYSSLSRPNAHECTHLQQTTQEAFMKASCAHGTLSFALPTTAPVSSAILPCRTPSIFLHSKKRAKVQSSLSRAYSSRLEHILPPFRNVLGQITHHQEGQPCPDMVRPPNAHSASRNFPFFLTFFEVHVYFLSAVWCVFSSLFHHSTSPLTLSISLLLHIRSVANNQRKITKRIAYSFDVSKAW